MNDHRLLERITLNPKVMVGKPVIKETRITVEHILNLMAHGEAIESIVEDYDGLEAQDVYACLLFATKSLGDITFMPLTVQTR